MRQTAWCSVMILLGLVLVVWPRPPVLAQDTNGADLVPMVIELITGQDKDLRSGT